MVFAYEAPHPVVDSNVTRVLARIWGVAGDVSRSSHRVKLHLLYEKWRGPHSPSRFAQALLDFGALHCTALRPKCTSCLLQQYCVAYAQGRVHEIPPRRKMIKEHVYFHYLLLEDHRRRVFVTRRRSGTFWSGLYEFPVVESEESFMDEEGLIGQIAAHARDRLTLHYTGMGNRQVLSHRMVHARLYRFSSMDSEQVQDFIERFSNGGMWADARELRALPMSKLMDGFRQWWLGQRN